MSRHPEGRGAFYLFMVFMGLCFVALWAMMS